MKEVTCKNCGAVFSENLAKCPYCGTMNKKGAYRRFREKISEMIDSMLGLKDEAYRSISRMILLSIFRSLIMIAIVIGIAFVCSRFAKVNYYNDREYDEEAYETILWEDENLDKLEEAYKNDDFDTIEKLYYENSSVVSHWTHYPDYTLKKKFRDINNRTYFSEYVLTDVLYFLFYPDYYAGYNSFSKINKENYELMCQSLITMMNQEGFSEAKMEEIYRKHADAYGYLRASDLKEYLEEGKNG